MLLFANVQSQDDTTDDADVNLLEGLTGTEDVLNDNALNDLEVLGIVSNFSSGITSGISFNWLVNNFVFYSHYELGANN